MASGRWKADEAMVKEGAHRVVFVQDQGPVNVGIGNALQRAKVMDLHKQFG